MRSNGAIAGTVARPAPCAPAHRTRPRSRPRSRPRVALLIDTSQAPGRQVLRGIAQFTRERQAWAVYFEPGSATEVVRRLASVSGDGLIAHISTPQVGEAVAKLNVPLVTVLGNGPHGGAPWVDVDHAALARLAAGHLQRCGCQAFGFVEVRGANGSRQRSAAFAGEVRTFGGHVDVFGPDAAATYEVHQRELARWLARLPKPAGILATDDACGRHVLDAARRAGLSVPDEVAVIGVDDDEPICELADPPLSSVRPDYAQVGFRAAELLDEMMRGEKLSRRTIHLAAEVVVRQSTDVAALADPDIVRAVRFIRHNACNGIRVEHVADDVHLSRSTLKRRFQAAMKRSVHDEILRVRLGCAQELLAQTDLPLDAVAQRAGFRHQEYMGAVFRAKLGRTPADVRRQGSGGF